MKKFIILFLCIISLWAFQTQAYNGSIHNNYVMNTELKLIIEQVENMYTTDEKRIEALEMVIKDIEDIKANNYLSSEFTDLLNDKRRGILLRIEKYRGEIKDEKKNRYDKYKGMIGYKDPRSGKSNYYYKTGEAVALWGDFKITLRSIDNGRTERVGAFRIIGKNNAYHDVNIVANNDTGFEAESLYVRNNGNYKIYEAKVSTSGGQTNYYFENLPDDSYYSVFARIDANSQTFIDNTITTLKLQSIESGSVDNENTVGTVTFSDKEGSYSPHYHYSDYNKYPGNVTIINNYYNDSKKEERKITKWNKTTETKIPRKSEKLTTLFLKKLKKEQFISLGEVNKSGSSTNLSLSIEDAGSSDNYVVFSDVYLFQTFGNSYVKGKLIGKKDGKLIYTFSNLKENGVYAIKGKLEYVRNYSPITLQTKKGGIVVGKTKLK